MFLKTMYVTNNTNVAKIAQANGVDYIFVDLEVMGKASRQNGRDAVLSQHSMEDISAVRAALCESKLLVRVNSLYEGTRGEVDEAVKRGADAMMLPMFRGAEDAAEFVEMVGGRAEVMLLAETVEAQRDIKRIAAVEGVSSIHIGLNDLHIARGMTFMFEPLADGTVEAMCGSIAAAGIPYGFGGIARLDDGMLPARNIIAEHYRLGSSQVIISRSFCDALKITDLEEIERSFSQGMKEIRDYARELPEMPAEFFAQNRLEVVEKTNAVVELLRSR